MNAIGLKVENYKNPLCNQYVAPRGYGFFYNGEFCGTIIWRRPNDINGIYIDKYENN